MTPEISADKICEDGHKAGSTIIDAIDHAYDVRCILSARKFRRVFDGMVEALTDEMSGTEADLFTASAYEALPACMSTAVERAEINANAWRAYEIYIGDARNAEADARADYLADLRRDERVGA